MRAPRFTKQQILGAAWLIFIVVITNLMRGAPLWVNIMMALLAVVAAISLWRDSRRR